MSKREKVLVAVIAVVLGLFFLDWVFVNQISKPLEDKTNELAGVQKQLFVSQQELMACREAEYQVERWKERALPADVNLAQTLYQEYLHELLESAGFDRPTITPVSAPTARRNDHFVKLPFQVRGRCDLIKLVRLLHDFSNIGYLHQIRKLSVTPIVDQGKLKELDVSLSIEAVSMRDAVAKNTLPTVKPDTKSKPKRSLADYALITDIDVFQPTKISAKPTTPPPPTEKTPSVTEPDERPDYYVIGAVAVDDVSSVWLSNRKTQKLMVIQQGADLAIGGMKAKVVKAIPSEILLQVADKLGQVKLGQSLASWTPVLAAEVSSNPKPQPNVQ